MTRTLAGKLGSSYPDDAKDNLRMNGDRALIIFLTTRHHRYTHKDLLDEPDIDVRVVGYAVLQAQQRRPLATYIFTDLDRVPFWQLRELAQIYRDLRANGCRVLNDPARALSRFGLLRSLNRAGVNSFDAYRVMSLTARENGRFSCALKATTRRRFPASSITRKI